MTPSIARLAAATAAAAVVISGYAAQTPAAIVTATPAHTPAVRPAVAVPAGSGVVAETVMVDGSEHSVSAAATPGVATQPRLAGTPASCADAAYTLSGYKVAGTIRFGYNGSGAPAAVAANAGVAVRNSLVAVSSGANRCGYAAGVKASGAYVGGSKRTPQLNTSGGCTGNDGVNVVGWGTLPNGYLAITCIYFVSGQVVNADVMLSKRYAWFLSRPAGCQNTYDLQSVLTHEQGHTFGLSHVDPTAHRTETMATLIGPCDISKRQLGRGDYAGLVRLYGHR
jgi:Matrixin